MKVAPKKATREKEGAEIVLMARGRFRERYGSAVFACCGTGKKMAEATGGARRQIQSALVFVHDVSRHRAETACRKPDTWFATSKPSTQHSYQIITVNSIGS